MATKDTMTMNTKTHMSDTEKQRATKRNTITTVPTKCMNPDTCCRETTMALEMPLTRKNKNNPTLQETFIIKNVNAKQLQGGTIFFERDGGYRAAWGFID